MHNVNIEDKAVNAIRLLAVDGVQKANSGHPGLPLGAAPAAYTLWAKFLKFNPKNSNWRDRDRFILSAGHGSMLLYSLLHIFGYNVTIDDLKQFRQEGSKTPGHPEYKHTEGVEITTGPLGQGIANAVGMAMAESYLAANFNKPGFGIVNHYTYALCGDGCLMEGVSAEAASLAGTLGLGKLIVLYDSNNITIEGDTNIAFRENVRKRFESYEWQTLLVENGNDIDAIYRAIEAAKAETNKPTIIEIKTKIGYGSPNKQGKSSAHGEPLGKDEIVATRKNLGWEYTEDFFIPQDVKEFIAEIIEEKESSEKDWNALFDAYKNQYPGEADSFEKWFSGKVYYDFLNDEEFWKYSGNLATRKSSEEILNKVAKVVPNLFGGSADLSPSTFTIMKDRGDFSRENRKGANLHFGIREHAMTAIANGIAAHGGLIPYISGFFIFCDYMKPSMRLSAMMKLPVINILTHDSIGVGEDGATHQPIEQLASLRSTPNFTVIRPCDTNETAAAWYLALTRTDSPTALILSRQVLPLLDETGKGALKGGYVLKDSEKNEPDIILIASGSEVSLIYKAKDILTEKGVDARVVSMPSIEIFEEQSDEYKEKVLPKKVVNRLVVEASSSFGWHKYTGFSGDIIAIDSFGDSAPANVLMEKFGFTVDNVVDKALKIVGR